MNSEQINLVQSTFADVRPIAPAAAELFYTRLFVLDPSLREVSKPRVRSAPFGEQKKTRFAGFAKSKLPPGNPRPATLCRGREGAPAGARPGQPPLQKAN